MTTVRGGAVRAILRSLFYFGLMLAAYIPSVILRRLVLRCSGAQIGRGVNLFRAVFTIAPWRLQIGEGTTVGDHSWLDSRGGLTIGKNVNISAQTAIWTAQHDINSPDFAGVTKPVIVGDRVWLSFRCTVLPGVTIGEGAVVATGAVVTRDVPPFTLVAGVPARPVAARSRDLQYEFINSPAVLRNYFL